MIFHSLRYAGKFYAQSSSKRHADYGFRRLQFDCGFDHSAGLNRKAQSANRRFQHAFRLSRSKREPFGRCFRLDLGMQSKRRLALPAGLMFRNSRMSYTDPVQSKSMSMQHLEYQREKLIDKFYRG